jgi:hypothetical protein
MSYQRRVSCDKKPELRISGLGPQVDAPFSEKGDLSFGDLLCFLRVIYLQEAAFDVPAHSVVRKRNVKAFSFSMLFYLTGVSEKRILIRPFLNFSPKERLNFCCLLSSFVVISGIRDANI